jgi:hypothetical protein
VRAIYLVNDGFLSKRDGLSAGSSHHKHRQSVEWMMAKRKKSAIRPRKGPSGALPPGARSETIAFDLGAGAPTGLTQEQFKESP